ncbi:MAG: hypothetical protein H6807_11120 [Planctomycetes bacterium]|nr:hypothetical protein [Planctomycetota bacterium]
MFPSRWPMTGASSLLAFFIVVLFACPLRAQDDDEIEAAWDDPDAPIDTRFDKARELNVEGRFEDCWAIYDEILRDRGPDVPTLVTYGNMLWRAGDLAGAEAKLKLACATNPKHIKAQQFLGQLYYFEGRRQLSRERFEYMHTLEFMRQDVLDSAKLNLGRIALQEEKFREAREHFMHLRKIGNHADRKSGNRGMDLVQTMLAMGDWPRLDTIHLKIHFSPEIERYKKEAERKALGAELDAWIAKVVAFLGIEMPDPWHLYVFLDDDECHAKTGRPMAHGWDYSWWISYHAVNSEISLKHTLAVMLASRWGGSRPMSRSMVEGFCHHLADEGKDPHEIAKKLAENDFLPSIAQLHEHQRYRAQYGAGISWVDFFIRSYGLEAFKKLWCRFNIEVNLARYKEGRSKAIDFPAAFDTMFQAFAKVSFSQFEAAWRTKVLSLAGVEDD